MLLFRIINLFRYDENYYATAILPSRRFSVTVLVCRSSGTLLQCCCQDLFRSRDRDRDRDLDKMNSSALESRDHGLQITTLLFLLQCRRSSLSPFWPQTETVAFSN